MASPRSDRCDKIRRKGVYIYYTRIEFCDARRHRYFLSFFERIDFFSFFHLPTSNPLTEIAVKTISIVIITPILYIIGISMNWIRF